MKDSHLKSKVSPGLARRSSRVVDNPVAPKEPKTTQSPRPFKYAKDPGKGLGSSLMPSGLSKRKLLIFLRGFGTKHFIKQLIGFGKKHYRAIILVVLFVTSSVFTYNLGRSNGYKTDRDTVINKSEALTSKNLIDKKSIPYRSLSGSVTAIKDDAITIHTADGDKMTFALDNDTKYSQKAATKAHNDVKVGSQVTVFATDTNSTVATQIVIIR